MNAYNIRVESLRIVTIAICVQYAINIEKQVALDLSSDFILISQ